MPAGLFAGLVAVLATSLIERQGGLVGGLLATLPTTIIPAAAGIFHQSASASDFATSMGAVPVGMLVNALFLLLWRVLPPRLPIQRPRVRLAAVTGLTLLAWAAGALALVLLLQHLRGSGASMVAVGLGTTLLTVAVGVLACLRPRPAPRGTQPVGLGVLLSRGVLAALAIGAAVLISGLGGALAAGVASVFPAIFLTTMVSLWWSQGEGVPVGAVGPMMLGSASVSAYALLATLTLPALGLALGSLLAWGLSAGLVTLPATLWLRSRPVAA